MSYLSVIARLRTSLILRWVVSYQGAIFLFAVSSVYRSRLFMRMGYAALIYSASSLRRSSILSGTLFKDVRFSCYWELSV